VIPEIDLCRVANLMLTRYGDNAEVESAKSGDAPGGRRPGDHRLCRLGQPDGPI
jgi:hypothetical protein